MLRDYMPENVDSIDEIVLNVLTFDQGELADADKREWFEGRIKNNSHFVALKCEGAYTFAPGRFAIYKDNDLDKRFGSSHNQGNEHERILNKILGSPMKSGDSGHEEIDVEYL